MLGGLALSVVLLVVYLTMQQRKFAGIRGEVSQMEEDSRLREHQNKERLNALLNIGRMMGSFSNLEKSLQYITDTSLELFNGHQASLMLLDSETNVLRVKAATGHLRADEVKVATIKVGEGVSGWVAKNSQPLLLGPDVDLSQYPGLNIPGLDMTAAMVVPVLVRDELVGVFSVRSRTTGIRYSEEDLQAIRVFAENIGTVIHHAEHVDWMRKTLEKYRLERSGSHVG
jgi:signal transduction protein with GAF and PtsI domain